MSMNAVEVEELVKHYGSFALSGLSFTVPKGYITGLIGPNGAGKSTVIKAIMGMVLPEEGRITVLGNAVTGKEGSYKQQIGYISDESIYYEYLSMEQMKRIVAPFYDRWDEALFTKYMELFELPKRKKI
ncbi:MAG: ATP-binding cassette domain-containing protein, partial [Paenibacillaceae bacterium]|nr:ATP-binding cassette domain-containing protein [Paenibacillaceae bacterium]